MPEKATIERARKRLRQGKSASTAAGEFVREEIHHVRRGRHGARSAEQAIASGLLEGPPRRCPAQAARGRIHLEAYAACRAR